MGYLISSKMGSSLENFISVEQLSNTSELISQGVGPPSTQAWYRSQEDRVADERRQWSREQGSLHRGQGKGAEAEDRP